MEKSVESQKCGASPLSAGNCGFGSMREVFTWNVREEFNDDEPIYNMIIWYKYASSIAHSI